MTVTYNYDRSYDARNKRYNELWKKGVAKSEARYTVVCTRNAADGDFTSGHSGQRFYFKHRATAIAFAQHYSDMYDHVAGVYRMPEFIARVDVR